MKVFSILPEIRLQVFYASKLKKWSKYRGIKMILMKRFFFSSSVKEIIILCNILVQKPRYFLLLFFLQLLQWHYASIVVL